MNDRSIPCSCSVPAPDRSIVVISPSWLNQRTAACRDASFLLLLWLLLAFLTLLCLALLFMDGGGHVPCPCFGLVTSSNFSLRSVDLLTFFLSLSPFFLLHFFTSLPLSSFFSHLPPLIRCLNSPPFRPTLSIFLSLSPLSTIVLTVRPCFSIWHSFLHNQHSTLNPSTPFLPELKGKDKGTKSSTNLFQQ